MKTFVCVESVAMVLPDLKDTRDIKKNIKVIGIEIIYDGIEAETLESQASFQIQVSSEAQIIWKQA